METPEPESVSSVARYVVGPQPHTLPSALEGTPVSRLRPVIESLRPEGGIALITAGWQEREAEDEALRRGLGLSEDVAVTNLELFRRSEALFDEDHELFLALRQRRLRLKELQRLHRLRLDPLLAALRLLQAESPRVNDPEGELLDGERAAALEVVRDLDRHHLEAVAEVRAQVDEEWFSPSRPVVERLVGEVRELLAGTSTVVVAGGHVEALLVRLRLFDLEPMLRQRNLVAWSAGAMALAQTVLLFHDHPPWGAGNAEVLDQGLNLLPGLLPLPHARWRLRLDDQDRVSALAMRMAPLLPVVLEEDSQLELRNGTWVGSRVSLLEADGTVDPVGDEERELAA